MNLRRPKENEYNSYYEHYISLVEGEDFLSTLKTNLESTTSLLQSLSEEKWNFQYAPEKWTIKEMMIHLIDTERVFSYRAMRISRNDKTALPGFDHNDFVPNSNAKNRTSQSIIEEYQSVRSATIHLYQNLSTEQLNRIGTASDSQFSTLAFGYMTAGHELHHQNLINERYLAS